MNDLKEKSKYDYLTLSRGISCIDYLLPAAGDERCDDITGTWGNYPDRTITRCTHYSGRDLTATTTKLYRKLINFVTLNQ